MSFSITILTHRSPLPTPSHPFLRLAPRPAPHACRSAWSASNPLDGADADADAFLDHCVSFLAQCDEHQVKLAASKFAAVAQRCTEVAVRLGKSMKVIRPLARALEMLSPNPHCLTPIHKDFLQVCILAKCYHLAAPVVGRAIMEVKPNKTALRR